MDSAAVLRGSKMPIEAEPESVVHIKMPMMRDYSTSGGHFACAEVFGCANKNLTKKGQQLLPVKSTVVGERTSPPRQVVPCPFYAEAAHAPTCCCTPLAV